MLSANQFNSLLLHEVGGETQSQNSGFGKRHHGHIRTGNFDGGMIHQFFNLIEIHIFVGEEARTSGGILRKNTEKQMFGAHVAVIITLSIIIGFLKRKTSILGQFIHYFSKFILHNSIV